MSGIMIGAPMYEIPEAVVPTIEMYGLFLNCGSVE